MVVGITNFGAYIPKYRISSALISEIWESRFKGERSVANYDEDSITMAVAAAENALGLNYEKKINGLFSASLSMPYKDKQNAVIVAEALDLDREIMTAEFTGSVRVGTTALRAAIDSVGNGINKNTLVTAAEKCQVVPGAKNEIELGDGAAAIVLGTENVVAEVEGVLSIAEDFNDIWMRQEDTIAHEADAKFILEQGYSRIYSQVVKELLNKVQLNPKDISKVIFYSPDIRTNKVLSKKLNFSPEAYIQDDILNLVGNTRSANPLLGLVYALENSNPNERILVLGYGSGADALLFKVTENIVKYKTLRSIKEQIENKKLFKTYGDYLNIRGLVPEEDIDPYSSMMLLWRESKSILRFYGKKCNDCGAIQYPVRRVCWKCKSKDNLTDYKLPKKGKIFTFAEDYLVPVPKSPIIMSVVDIDRGGRIYTQMTDCEIDKVEIGMDVGFTFRLLHKGQGLNHYFWKSIPYRGR